MRFGVQTIMAQYSRSARRGSQNSRYGITGCRRRPKDDSEPEPDVVPFEIRQIERTAARGRCSPSLHVPGLGVTKLIALRGVITSQQPIAAACRDINLM